MKKTKRAKRSTNTRVKSEYTGPILVLKTTKDGGEPHVNGSGDGKGGKIATAFRWPRYGVVTCDDWDPKPECGHGFHGLEFGEGTWNLLREDETPADEWRVIRVPPGDFVRLTDDGNVKVKFRTGEVVYSGCKAGAMTYVMCSPEAMDRAKVLAPDPKDGDSSKAASSGNYSTAASSGNYSTAEQKGERGIAAAIGDGVRAKSGENGLLILTWWDGSARRYRACVGEVGVDGIKADTWYRVEGGKLVKAES